MNKSLIESIKNIFKLEPSAVIVIYENDHEGHSSVSVYGKDADEKKVERKRHGFLFECPNCHRSWYLRTAPPPRKCRYCGRKFSVEAASPSVKEVAIKDIEADEKNQDAASDFIEVPKSFVRGEMMRIGSFVWHDMWKTGVITSLGYDSDDRCIVAFGKMRIEKTFLRAGCNKMYKDWLERIGDKKFIHIKYPTKELQ